MATSEVKNPVIVKAYLDLPDDLKTLVRILAVQAMGCSANDLLPVVKELDVRSGDGKPHTPLSLTTALRKLSRIRLVQKSHGKLQCHEGIRIFAVTEAVLAQEFQAISRAVCRHMISFEAAASHIMMRKEDAYYRCLQMTIFGGFADSEFENLLAMGNRFLFSKRQKSSSLVSMFSEPFRQELMDALAPDIRSRVLMAVVHEASYNLNPVQPMIRYGLDFFLQHSPDATARYNLLQIMLVRGDVQGVESYLNEEKKKDLFQHHLFRGGCLFLTHNNDAALESFGEVISIVISRQNSNRLVSLRVVVTFFLIMALFKRQDMRSYQIARIFIRNLKTSSVNLDAILDAADLLFSDEGPEGETDPLSSPYNFRTESFYQFFFLLFRALKNPECVRPQVNHLLYIQNKAQRAGYAWIAAEASSILAKLGQDTEKNQNLAEQLHRECKTIGVVDSVVLMPQWERTLHALSRIAEYKDAGTGSSDDSQRLIWLISFHKDIRRVTLVPKLQKKTSRDVWTKGRVVSLKSLYTGNRDMAFLTDQDRRVCNTIAPEDDVGRFSRYYYHNSFEFDMDAALQALVGHPLVFQEEDPAIAVELVAGEPQIRLRTRKKSIQVFMDPMPGASDQKVALVKETQTRYQVVTFSKTHVEIANLLGKKGIEMPEEAGELATRAMAALSGILPISSDMAVAGTGDIREVPADPTPHVHLTPFQNGICMEVWMRPVPDGGSYFRPGRGGSHVYADLKGEKVQAVRDLSLERKRVKDILARCPTLSHLEPVEDRWEMNDPDQGLELLLDLKQCESDIVLKWPQGEKFRIVSRISTNRLSLNIRKERGWFKATGTLEVDENLTLNLKTLLELTQQRNSRFIPLDDGTFLAITRKLKERLEELQAFSSGHGQGVRFSALAMPAVLDITAEAGQVTADAEWDARRQKFEEIITPELPGTLRAELRGYQKDGFAWLAQLLHWEVGACLADDMGLGKTVQALAVMLLTAGQGPSLVVAPLSVMANWQTECRRFTPTLEPRVFGPGDRQQFLNSLGPFDLVITSYGLLQTESEKLAGVTWQVALLDEAQAIKNMKTKRSRAAMAMNARFRMITTGTPLENHLDELWTLFHYINPGLLGTFRQFREKFALPVERDQSTTASRLLKKLIRPFILRRLKTDVLKELPAKTEVNLYVEMSPDEQTLYEAQRQLALERIAAVTDAPAGQKHLAILAELTRLRRLCCHPDLVAPELKIPSSKLRVFSDTITELMENRHKALVFSQFVSHLEILKNHLDSRNISYQYLDGSTPVRVRQQRIDAFQSGQGEVFLISLKAGGSGLNLTAADYVIHMDPWWNPAVEDQASDRAHRIGQTRPVTVYRLVVRDSIEERILKLHGEKREMAENLLAGTDVAGKVSVGDLLALLQSAGE